MYIDENCLLPLKMREMFAIAASFVKIVRNRGFTRFFQNPKEYSLTF